MLYSAAGIRNHGQTIATQRKTLETDLALCEAITDGLLEALAFTLTNPLCRKEVPEMALNPTPRNSPASGSACGSTASIVRRRTSMGWGGQTRPPTRRRPISLCVT